MNEKGNKGYFCAETVPTDTAELDREAHSGPSL